MDYVHREAALVIQKCTRGFLARLKIKRDSAAACCIQKHFRLAKAKRDRDRLVRAAIIIQGGARILAAKRQRKEREDLRRAWAKAAKKAESERLNVRAKEQKKLNLRYACVRREAKRWKLRALKVEQDGWKAHYILKGWCLEKVEAAAKEVKEADERALDISRFYYATKAAIEEHHEKQLKSLKEEFYAERRAEQLASEETTSMMLAEAESKCWNLHCKLERSAHKALEQAAALKATQDALAALSRDKDDLLDELQKGEEAMVHANDALGDLLKESRGVAVKLQKHTEAVNENEAMLTTLVDLVAQIEAGAQQLAGAAQLGAPAECQEALGASLDWAGQYECIRQRVMRAGAALLPALQRTQRAKEELERVLTCSLTHEIFRRPMRAPDGEVYEERMIREWLRRKPSSPLTKQSMRPAELHHDRLVQQAAHALRLLIGQEADSEEVVELDGTEEEVSPEEPLLLGAIRRRDEAAALELLQLAVQTERLNERFGDEGALEGMTVLHYALLHGLPAVALAIALHPEFTMHRAKMGRWECITPMHIAASLGLHDVCKALLQRHGVGLLADRVEHSVVFDMPGGEELVLQRGDHPLSRAQLHQHLEIERMFRAAAETVLRGQQDWRTSCPLGGTPF